MNHISVLHSSKVLLQSPDALLPRSPMEVADAPEQLSEDGRLLLAQPWFEISQHFLRRGLTVHTGLKGNKVAQIHQQFVMLSGWSRGGAPSWSSGILLLFLCFVSLAGRQAEVIADSHLSQQGGGGERGTI